MVSPVCTAFPLLHLPSVVHQSGEAIAAKRIGADPLVLVLVLVLLLLSPLWLPLPLLLCAVGGWMT